MSRVAVGAPNPFIPVDGPPSPVHTDIPGTHGQIPTGCPSLVMMLIQVRIKSPESELGKLEMSEGMSGGQENERHDWTLGWGDDLGCKNLRPHGAYLLLEKGLSFIRFQNWVDGMARDRTRISHS